MSVWREAAHAALSAGKRWVLGRPGEALDYELLLCFYAGIVRQRLRDRHAVAREAPLAAPR